LLIQRSYIVEKHTAYIRVGEIEASLLYYGLLLFKRGCMFSKFYDFFTPPPPWLDAAPPLRLEMLPPWGT
jgi:hypothetical protein